MNKGPELSVKCDPWTTKPVIPVIFFWDQLSIDIWFVTREQYLADIQLCENLESEGAKEYKYWENAFKAVQMKSSAMHITIQFVLYLQ